METTTPETTGPFDDPVVTITLGSHLTPEDIADVAIGRARISLDRDLIHTRLRAAREVVDRALADDLPTYGLNRGLGPLRDAVIAPERLSDFQRYVIVSHAAAIGEPLTRTEGRATLVSRLNTLAAGGSGASVELFDGLFDLLIHDVVPVIPAEGSIGAADLSQMAAIGMVLLGGGRAWFPGEDRIVPGGEALAAAGLSPITLGPKDGLALVGSNALSVATAALTHRRTDLVAERADLVTALTVEALRANVSPYDPVALRARPHPGQQISGRRVREALAGGSLAAGETRPRSLQDPISIRTTPQVHGALIDELIRVSRLVQIELSSAPDNPYLDVEGGRFISNGNFSITGLAVAYDSLRMILAHVALLSERRVALLVKELRQSISLDDQIAMVRSDAGYVTPVILAQTASSLAARAKHAASPVSLTGTTVGDGVEDHASMAYSAIRATDEILGTIEGLLAIEALLAVSLLCQTQRVHPRELGAPVSRLVATIEEITLTHDTTSDVVAKVTEALRRERRGEDHSEIGVAVSAPQVPHEQEVARHDQLH